MIELFAAGGPCFAALAMQIERENKQTPSQVPVMPSDDPEESNQGDEQ